jgi:hypothetical protein
LNLGDDDDVGVEAEDGSRTGWEDTIILAFSLPLLSLAVAWFSEEALDFLSLWHG